jgi:hypothetical protein
MIETKQLTNKLGNLQFLLMILGNFFVVRSEHKLKIIWTKN